DSNGQDYLRNRYFSAKELEKVCEAWIEKVDIFKGVIKFNPSKAKRKEFVPE
ncbi:30329_t:CDS:1, partial [Racocetra persica]